MNRVYSLKPLVFARVLAEVLTLFICGLLPISWALSGSYSGFPGYAQPIAFAVSLCALALLPCYGFITWSVISDENGITVRTFYSKEFCKWQEIKSMTLSAGGTHGGYVITTVEGKKLMFPTFLKGCHELVQEIRGNLPARGGEQGGCKSFRCGRFFLTIQSLKMLLSLTFAGIFWIFVLHDFLPKSHVQSDSILMVGFAVILSAALLLKLFQLVLMPTEIETSDSEIALKSPLYALKLPWTQVFKVSEAPPLLPEGYILKTKRGSFYIAGAIEASDELAGQIGKKCVPVPTRSTKPRTRR
jgi:hypothetical protein